MALRARLLHREDAALETHLAATVAGVAGIELAVLGAGALARLALGQGRDFDPALDAGHGFLEVEFHHVADVGPATRSARSAAADDVAEDLADDVAHVGVPGTGVAAPPAVPDPAVAVLVDLPALAPART